MLRHTAHLASKTERMVCLGLSNQNELIYNGAARRIVMIDGEEETDGDAEHEAERDAEQKAEHEAEHEAE